MSTVDPFDLLNIDPPANIRCGQDPWTVASHARPLEERGLFQLFPRHWTTPIRLNTSKLSSSRVQLTITHPGVGAVNAVLFTTYGATSRVISPTISDRSALPMSTVFLSGA